MKRWPGVACSVAVLLGLLAMTPAARAEAQDVSAAAPGCAPFVYCAGPDHAHADAATDTVVLVHGMDAQGHRSWLPILPALAARYRVIAPDLPGFGATAAVGCGGLAGSTPAEYARFLHTLIGEKPSQTAPGRVHLVGHSLGAAIALRYAADYPAQVHKLVLIDAAGILNKVVFVQHVLEAQGAGLPAAITENLGPLNLFKGPLRALRSGLLLGPETGIDSLLAHLPAATRRPWLGDNTQFDSALALMAEEFTTTLHTLTLPTSIIWGRNDAIAPLRSAQLLAGRLRNVDLQIIDNAGHNPMTEQTQDTITALLTALTKTPELPPQLPPQTLVTLSAPPLSTQQYSDNKTANGSESEPRDFVCERQSHLSISGTYRHIKLNQCRNITLHNVRAQTLTLERSDAQAEHLVLNSAGSVNNETSAINCRASQLRATVLDVHAGQLMALDNCFLDIAGGQLVARQSLGQIGRASTLEFSVSRITLADKNWTLHRNFYHVRGELDRVLAP